MRRHLIFFLFINLFWTTATLVQADPCYFESNYKIKIPDYNNSNEIKPYKLDISQNEIDRISKKYDVDIQTECSDPLFFEIYDPQKNPIYRILDAHVGGWDHLYLVFKKTPDGWKFLKDLSISQINNSSAIKVFNYQHHIFMALVDVQDHGAGPTGAFGVANYDVYLMDQSMEHAGDFISDGNPESSIMGQLSYQTSDFKISDQNDCLLELDFKIKFDAFWGSIITDENKKYIFDDFNAFSNTFKLFYQWDESKKKFVFNAELSDFKTDPVNVNFEDIDEYHFLTLFYPELVEIAKEHNKNKNIWLMSTLDYVKGTDPNSLELKKNLLKLMNQN